VSSASDEIEALWEKRSRRKRKGTAEKRRALKFNLL